MVSDRRLDYTPEQRMVRATEKIADVLATLNGILVVWTTYYVLGQIGHFVAWLMAKH